MIYPIENFRPTQFADIIGYKNQRLVEEIQQACRKRLPQRRLLHGLTGTGKTSLCELAFRSYQCKSPDPATADPCGECRGCKQANAAFNETPGNYFPYMIDGTDPLDPEQLHEILARATNNIVEPLIFVDEIGSIGSPVQKCFLKFLDQNPEAIFLAASMPGETSKPPVIDALSDRLKVSTLSAPSSTEIADYLHTKLPAWELKAPTDLLKELVVRAKTFRKSLRTLHQLQSYPARTLTPEILEDLLP